jgi:hypothetical protein
MTGGTYPTGNPLDLSSYGFATSDTAELYHPRNLRSAPALLSLGASGQGAVLHAGTSRVVSASDPASVGEAIEIYGTGLNEGGVIPPQVSIGGRLAQVLSRPQPGECADACWSCIGWDSSRVVELHGPSQQCGHDWGSGKR